MDCRNSRRFIETSQSERMLAKTCRKGRAKADGAPMLFGKRLITQPSSPAS
jgi:hypothetical protein